MKYLPMVVYAEHRGGFRVHVLFNDASDNTIDFEPWLEGPMFEPLRDPAYFRRFFLDGGTMIWPNRADIAPEALYEVPGRRGRSLTTLAAGEGASSVTAPADYAAPWRLKRSVRPSELVMPMRWPPKSRPNSGCIRLPTSVRA